MNQIVFLLMTLTLLLILSTLRIGWEEHGESVENRLCETDEITRAVWRGHTCINAFAAVRLMLPDDRWGIAAPLSPCQDARPFPLAVHPCARADLAAVFRFYGAQSGRQRDGFPRT